MIAKVLNRSQFFRKDWLHFLPLAVLIVLIQLSTSPILHAQRGLEYPLNNRVIINYQDYVVYAEVKTEGIMPKAKDKFYYYWFNSNDIKKTRGGYDGKLLQGKYTEFYTNKDLKAKGRFKNGRKKGKWKYWYPNGQFKEVIKWRKKGRVGKFKLYNENGNFLKKGRYKNDKLDGVVREIVYGVPTKKRYENGVEIIKEKKEKRIKEKKPKDEKIPADNENVDTKKEKKSIFRLFSRSKKDSLNTAAQENDSRTPATNEKKSKKENNKKDKPEVEKKSKKDKKQSEPNPAENTNKQTTPKEKKPKKKTNEQ